MAIRAPDGANNSERPVDALAVKNIAYPLTHNMKPRDASASKNLTHKIKRMH